MNDGIRIPIEVPFNGAGAAAAKTALDDIARSAQRSGATTATSAAQIGTEMGKASKGMQEGMRAASLAAEVLRGNIFAAGGAAKALGAVLKSGPIGWGVAIGAFVAQALTPFIASWVTAKKKVEETAVAMKGAYEDAKHLRDVKFEALKSELDQVNQRASQLVGYFKQALEYAGKADEAKLNADILAIENDASLSPTEKASKIAALRAGYTARSRAREDAGRSLEESAARENLKRATVERDTRVSEAEQQRAHVNAIEQDRLNRAKEIADVQGKLTQADKRVATAEAAAVAGGPAEAAEYAAAQKERTGLRDRLQGLQERQTIATSEGAQKSFANQRAILGERDSAAKGATQGFETARSSYEKLVGDNRSAAPYVTEIRKQEDRGTAENLKKQQREAAAEVTREAQGYQTSEQKRANAIGEQIKTVQNELDHRSGTSAWASNADLVEKLEQMKAVQATHLANANRSISDIATNLTRNQVEQAKVMRRANDDTVAGLQESARQAENMRSYSQ